MTRTEAEPTPTEKAFSAARESARQCLQAAADAVALKVSADGIICSGLMRKPGRKPISVLVLWPCWVLELEPGTGAIIA